MADRVLFLDFDGVLHPTDSYGDGPITLPIADMIPGRRLFRWTGFLADLLVEHPDVRVVVHSSWRHRYDAADLAEFLGRLGPRVAGAAPRGARHEAIAEWVAAHRPVAWLVLDDDHAAFPEPDEPVLVCPPDMGVTAPGIVDAIRQWLTATAPGPIGTRPAASSLEGPAGESALDDADRRAGGEAGPAKAGRRL